MSRPTDTPFIPPCKLCKLSNVTPTPPRLSPTHLPSVDSYCNQPACGAFFDPLCFSYVCGAVSASAGLSLAQAAGLSDGDVFPELSNLFQPTSRFG